MGVTEALELVAAALATGATYLGTGRLWATMLVAAVACAYFAHAWLWGPAPEDPAAGQDITGGQVDKVNLKGGGFALIPNPGAQHRRGGTRRTPTQKAAS
jgi:hypothetical protein